MRKSGLTGDEAYILSKHGGTTEDLGPLKKEISLIKEDLSNKITKFYASNQGETHITDSDNGKIQDMMLYGKSSQDGTPSPENPVEIKSVVNPVIKICGKNLFDSKKFPIILNRAIDTNTGNSYESLSGNYCATEKYIPFPYSGKKISFNASMSLCAYDKDYKFISTVNKNNGQVPTGTMYVRFDIKTEDKDKAQIELSENTTTYEPYKEQTIQLPITLNAISVSRGGNVTINGQQYIADYVDVERGKLVEKLKSFTISDIKAITTWGVNENADNITGFYFYMSTNGLPKSNNEVMTSTILRYVDNAWGGKNVGCAISSDSYDNYVTLSVPTNMLEDISSNENACASLVKICENTNAVFFYSMTSPIETDLTPEEIEAFKELVTYYPVTSISVNSEQLDGCAVFNYPISIKNGWNYIKKQLNDNRDYIYDMDLQSAEAYVNSEYAAALTELEV